MRSTSLSSSRRILLSPFAMLVVVLLCLSFVNVCLAQYFSSGDFSSGGDSSSGDFGSSSTSFDSSSDSPFSSSSDTPFSSSGGGSSGSSGGSSEGSSGSSGGSSEGSSGSSGGSSGSSAGSSGSSAGSSGSSGSGASTGKSSGGSAAHTSAARATSAPKQATSAPKQATSAPKQATSAPKQATSAPLRGVSSSTGGIGCATATVASLSLSANGFSFIQNGEGFGPFYYYDTATPPQATIGFGHDCFQNKDCTSSTYTKGYVTLAEATTILHADAATATAQVRKGITSTAQLTQNQFNVLVDMALNRGSVPASMASFVNGYNGAQIPLQTFSNQVSSTSGGSTLRKQQEATYSLSCGTPTYAYVQGDGQYCTSGNMTGLCLDSRIYACPTGAFVSGTTGCHSDAGNIQCCAIPTPAGKTTSTVQLTLALSSQPADVPQFTGATVNPFTFNSNGAR